MQVVKSLDLALRIYYGIIAGKVPEMKTVGVVPEGAWDEIYAVLQGDTLERYDIELSNSHLKNIVFETVNGVFLRISLRKIEDLWAFEILTWYIRAREGRAERYPTSIFCQQPI